MPLQTIASLLIPCARSLWAAAQQSDEAIHAFLKRTVKEKTG